MVLSCKSPPWRGTGVVPKGWHPPVRLSKKHQLKFEALKQFLEAPRRPGKQSIANKNSISLVKARLIIAYIIENFE